MTVANFRNGRLNSIKRATRPLVAEEGENFHAHALYSSWEGQGRGHTPATCRGRHLFTWGGGWRDSCGRVPHSRLPAWSPPPPGQGVALTLYLWTCHWEEQSDTHVQCSYLTMAHLSMGKHAAGRRYACWKAGGGLCALET